MSVIQPPATRQISLKYPNLVTIPYKPLAWELLAVPSNWRPWLPEGFGKLYMRNFAWKMILLSRSSADL